MKLVIIVPDGLADKPQPVLDNRTPLAAAATPAMDRMASEGVIGTATVLEAGGETDSNHALMTILGYAGSDITGRGYYEALDREIQLGDDEWAARCQLVTTDGNAITDPTGGKTSTTESRQLIQLLNDQAGIEGVTFHFGNRSNHLVTVKGAYPEGMTLHSPWEVIKKPFADYLPSGDSVIAKIVARSREVLATSDINAERKRLEENEANMAYIYGAGRRVDYSSLEDRLGGSCALVSYSSMARGLARAVHASRVIHPEESHDPVEELRHLAIDARSAMEKSDVVIVHVSFPDKYTSNRLGAQGKVQGIERIDEYVVRPLLEQVMGAEGIRLAVVPTLVSDTATRAHLTDPVPFLLAGSGVPASGTTAADEGLAAAAGVSLTAGSEGLLGQLRTHGS